MASRTSFSQRRDSEIGGRGAGAAGGAGATGIANTALDAGASTFLRARKRSTTFAVTSGAATPRPARYFSTAATTVPLKIRRTGLGSRRNFERLFGRAQE